MTRSLHILLFTAVLLTPVAQAKYREDGIKSGHGVEYPIHLHPVLEIGATIGTPSIIGNFVIGYWKGGKFPLLLRLSGMFWRNNSGAQYELGFAIDREGHLRQNLTLGGIYVQEGDKNWSGVAAFYTLNWYGFVLQPGITIGKGSLRSSSPQPLIQLGYTYLFRL